MVTSSVFNETPTCAARMAITVALHDATDARNNQPGAGAEALPPNAGGMSVRAASPFGPVTWNRNPPSSTAVAAGIFQRAFFGCWAGTLLIGLLGSRTLGVGQVRVLFFQAVCSPN